MTLLVNINPLMRFDGYYVLSDFLGVPNLQSRAFAMGRWALREILFDIAAPPPESVSRKLRLIMVLYAVCIWLYRAVVFTGIAILVYTMFFKVLGVILFAIEMIWFIAWPVVSEIVEWWRMRSQIRQSPRAWATLSACAAMLMVFIIPWRTNIGRRRSSPRCRKQNSSRPLPRRS